MNESKIFYCVRWYEGDTFVGQEKLPTVNDQLIRQWFGLGEEECLTDCHHVTPRLYHELMNHMAGKLDFDKYSFFIEAFVDDSSEVVDLGQ